VYWPMLLHRGPLRRVLVVCHGVGVTLKAVTDLDSVDSIDVAEISPDVIAMNDIIYPPSEQPLRDRRVKLHIEDGRQFLQLTDQRFDLITGEPPPPLTPGAVNLYTREYFQLIYDRLAEGGISTYWLPVGGGAAHGVTPIIRAFCDVFEDCSLWNGTLFDWILIGTRHAQGPASEDMFTRAWSHPVVGQRLREVLFETPQQFGATFMGDATYLNELTASTDALTDNHPRRVFPSSPNSLFADSKDPAAANAFVAALDSNRARLTFERSSFIRRFWPESLIKQTLTFFDQRGLIDGVMVARSNPLRYIAQLDELLTNTTLRRLPLWILGSNDVLQQVADTGNDGSGMVEYELGVRLLTARSYAAAANYLAAAERLGLAAARVHPLRVYALCRAGQLDAARQLTLQLEPAADADARHFWAWMESRFGIGPTKPSGTADH
jgi:spermidine synthase